jgi:ATP-dependent DNA helicase RecQ
MCDNCRYPKEQFEGMDDVKLLLETIIQAKERQKAKHIISVMVGDASSEVKTYKDDELELFGAGDEHEPQFWNAVIRQATIRGLIKKDIETYGTLSVTKEGREFIKKPTSFMLIKENDYSDVDDANDSNSRSGEKSASDMQLYKILEGVRNDVAEEEELPKYVIFSEQSLQEMAIHYPITLEELTSIAGVGQGKANKFGKPFIEVIADYVEENEIDRVQDMVVKSVVNKSGLKVHIIQNVDRKVPLEDIAKAKGKKLDDIIQEIEAIVGSGTKMNINYYINDMLDEEEQEEIFEYFMESETDDLEEAFNEFDEDYTVEQLRLMRIKFMSEVAN